MQTNAPLTIVITHHNADLDALASLIAAKRLYPGSIALHGQAISPPVQRYLAMHKDHFPLVPYAQIDPAQVERVIVVDVRDRRRLSEYEPMLQAASQIIVYDHHPACDFDLQTPHVTVEPTGACATLLLERLARAGLDHAMTPTEATLLLLGIYADTGKLTFDSTTPRDVDAAAALLRLGANLRIVNRYLVEAYTPEQRALLMQMMAHTHEISVSAVEIAIATGQAERFVRGASSVVHHLMNMGAHDAMFAVIEFFKNRRVQIIARSRVPYVDVGQLLSRFEGGGGHPGAAAATLKGVTREQVVAQLEALLRQAQLRPTRVRDAMSAPVQTIEHDDTLEHLERLLTGHNIRGVPVLRQGALCGVISARDLERARRAQALALPVAAYMTHEVETIAPDEPLEDAFALMTARDIGRLPVLDGERLIGLISRSDLLRCLYTRDCEANPDSTLALD